MKEVLATLVFKEGEVVADDGAVYTMRIHPYRTVDDLIDGVVVTFVDISAQKREAVSTAAEERLKVLEGTIGQWPGIAYVEEVASGHSLVVSHATTTILGYERAVLERATEAFWRALRPAGKRVRLRRQDGVLNEYRERTVVLARSTDGTPTHVLHFFRKRAAAKDI